MTLWRDSAESAIAILSIGPGVIREINFGCDNVVTMFGRNQPNSAVVLAMASGCNV